MWCTKIFSILVVCLSSSILSFSWANAKQTNQKTQSTASGDYGSVQIIDGWKTEAKNYQIALLFLLKPNWKTYWRNPGQSGLEPLFDWSRSTNIADVNVQWPQPEIFNNDEVITYGFKNELILPIVIKPTKFDKSINIDLKLDFGVCSDICIPISASLSLLNIGNGAMNEISKIEKVMEKIPTTITREQKKYINCKINLKNKIITVFAQSNLFSKVNQNTYAILEYQDSKTWLSNQTVTLDKKGLSLSAKINQVGNSNLIIDRSKIQTTLLNSGSGFNIIGCPDLTISTDILFKH